MRVLAILSHVDLPEAHLLAGLQHAGIALLVLCKMESRNLEILREAGVPCKNIHLKGRVDRRSIRTIRAAVKTHAPDIIHTFNKKALINSLLATSGTKIRHITYRGIVGNISAWNPEARLTFFNDRVEHIVCVCDAVRDSLLQLDMPPRKVVRIYKGHDPAWYQAWSRPQLLQTHSIPEDKVIIGTSAQWRPRKGLDVLLLAISRLQHPDIHLLVAGKVEKRTARQIHRNPHLRDCVHLLGNIPDAPARMGACDLFVMPSLRREGFAKSIIETLIQGVPAIISNCGGLPEMVQHEKTGLIVTPGDPADLAQAIHRLTHDAALRQQLGQAARTHICNAFPIEQTIQQHLQLYAKT